VYFLFRHSGCHTEKGVTPEIFCFAETVRALGACMLGSSAKEGPAMNRLFSVLFLSSLVLVFGPIRTSSQSTSDEETLKKLEIEGATHAGTSDADIAFGKKIEGEHVVSVDPLGHVSDQTPADVEKMSLGMRKADPDVKASIEIHEIKVRISGDTAIVTYAGTYNATGHKDARYDVPNAKFVAVDTWQKQSGKWKLLAQAIVATDPIPSDVYKLPPPPGMQ
jgi:ketosteroid isomerase-like protein